MNLHLRYLLTVLYSGGMFEVNGYATREEAEEKQKFYRDFNTYEDSFILDTKA